MWLRANASFDNRVIDIYIFFCTHCTFLISLKRVESHDFSTDQLNTELNKKRKWKLKSVGKHKRSTEKPSLFQAPRWSDPRNLERANTEITREGTGERKGGGLSFSCHRPLLPYDALIFSLAFHLRALRAWNRLRKALMVQIGKTREN